MGLEEELSASSHTLEMLVCPWVSGRPQPLATGRGEAGSTNSAEEGEGEGDGGVDGGGCDGVGGGACGPNGEGDAWIAFPILGVTLRPTVNILTDQRPVQLCSVIPWAGCHQTLQQTYRIFRDQLLVIFIVIIPWNTENNL